MATPFLNLDLPVVLTTLGPEWATKVNEAFEVIDEHDHSSGKGVQIKTAGLNINADLSFNDFRATDVKAVKLQDDLSATLTGATNAGSLYQVSNDLYYTNGSGVAIQLTSGGSIVSIPGSITSFTYNNVNADLVINAADNFVYLAVDTSLGRTITLPAASSVAAGRLYIIKDATGNAKANPITLAVTGGDTVDGESSFSADSEFGTYYVVSNGLDGWLVS